MRFIHRLALLLAILFTANLLSAPGQDKQDVPKPMPTPTNSKSFPTKSAEQTESDAQVELLLGKSGLKARRLADGVWVIRRGSVLLPYYQIVIASGPGYVLASVVIGNKKDLKFDSEMGYQLLRLAHELNYIKVGFDNGDDLFVRTELRLKLLDSEEFRMMIDRLAGAVDKAYGQAHPPIKFKRKSGN